MSDERNPFRGDESDTIPVPRDPDNVAPWLNAVVDALTKLRVHGRRDHDDTCLWERGQELVRTLSSWRDGQPTAEERNGVRMQVLAYVRLVGEYLARVRGSLPPP